MSISCLSVYTITQKIIHLKLKHIVVYENSSDKFDIGHCLIKVKVTVLLKDVSPFTTIQTLKSYISALAHVIKLRLKLSATVVTAQSSCTC